MRICYIVLTCEKYLPTRATYLLETSLKNVETRDIYFLSCKSIEPNIYGWDTADNYESCPMKYVRFFQNMTLDYDWYYFMDDDTYIFTDRLQTFVSNYNADDRLYIGHRCLNETFPVYMSGGAGFLLTKPLYLDLVQYIRSTPESELLKSIYGDYLMGLWLSNIEKEVVEVDVFHPSLSDDKKYISVHYLKTKEDYFSRVGNLWIQRPPKGALMPYDP